MACVGEVNGEPMVVSHKRHGPSTDTYSLTILIKLLELTDWQSYDDEERFKLLLRCGKSCVNASGTLTSLNRHQVGNVIGLQTSLVQFMHFLNESTIEVTLERKETTVGKGILRLRDTGVIEFDPNRAEDRLPLLEHFSILDTTDQPIGTVTMVLNAERNTAPPVDTDVCSQLGTDDIMYVVNEDRRRATEQQEALQRQMLVCNKCNVLRSPEDFSCQYELIDGILHNKAVSSTEKEIERIKQKLRDVALDETIGPHGDSDSMNGDALGGKICGLCRGLTITGVTCGEAASSSSGRKPARQPNKASQRQQQAPVKKATEPSTNDRTSSVLPDRCCERCRTCLNWLPEVCRCPKCGHKTRETAKADDRGSKRMHLFRHPIPDVEMSSEKTPSPMRSDSYTMLASSHSCPICHLRQCKCVDCACSPSPQNSEPCSRDPGSFSGMLHTGYGSNARPVTRRSTNTRGRLGCQTEGTDLNGTPTRRRSDQMRQVYEAKLTARGGQPMPTDGKTRPSAAQIRKSYYDFIRKVKRQNKNIYSYRFGRRHPGMVVGHKACMKQEQLVPAHMGWRWNTCTEGIGKRRPGWRPGAIRKPIVQLMQHFLKCFPTDNVPVTDKRTFGAHPPAAGSTGPLAGQKPTLQVSRHHGEYSITLNPLKDSETLKTATDPYLPCKPIKFLLTKDPRLTKLYLLRDELKAKGFTLCGCKQLEQCGHRNDREKRILVEELRRVAKRVGLPVDTSVADLPSRSESELNFEFTPPSAIIRPDARRPDVVIAETQYCEEDFKIKPIAPSDEMRPNAKQGTKGPNQRPAAKSGSGMGKGDGVGRSPEAGAKKGTKTNVTPGRKSVAVASKGTTGDASKKGPVAGQQGVKPSAAGVRISVAKAKGPAAKK